MTENPRFPSRIHIGLEKAFDLRYGENPHQEGAVYFEPGSNSPLANLQRLTGREPSLINITDIHAGLASVRMFDECAAVVIKHNTPCGIALGEWTSEALSRAIIADPESAFGGVIVLNAPLDLATARVIASFKDEKQGNIDVVAAPEVEEDALKLLKRVRKSMAVYSFGEIPVEPSQVDYKRIDGGYVVQTADSMRAIFDNWSVATEAQPTQKQLKQMKMGWKFITRIRSNAVIVVDGELPMTRGIGTGQTSRVRSTNIALEQAGENAKGAILVSDSFFPFGDSVAAAAKAGIAAIIQQGGSINDQASIDAVNQAGIPMVFTGRRAFWH